MANLTERINEIEMRLLYIEQYLGITLPEGWQSAESDERLKYNGEWNPPPPPPPLPARIIKEGKRPPVPPEPEETINGFTKSQLKIMFQWAKNTKLQQLTRNDFEELKKWQMLKDFYPDAPENYDDITL